MIKILFHTLFDVKGKVAIITGATGALGTAVSFGYGLAGMKVMVTGRNEEEVEGIMPRIKKRRHRM